MFDIGKRLVTLREIHGITANKLSKDISVDPSTINKIEKGTAKPSIDLLFKICNYFGISLAEFFDEKASELPLDLLQLIETVKKLNSEERKSLNQFLQLVIDKRYSSEL